MDKILLTHKNTTTATDKEFHNKAWWQRWKSGWWDPPFFERTDSENTMFLWLS